MDLHAQEKALLTDILYVLMGYSGDYITLLPVISGSSTLLDEEGDFRDVEFVVDQSADSSLAEMVLKIVPVAGCYCVVNQFVETHSRFEYGRVNHALGSAIRELLKVPPFFPYAF